jgi:putative CocE/NonD family hydrolase
MRDGTALAATVYRPARNGSPAGGAFPVILERTPYGRRRLDLHLMGKFFAARGYNVVLQDVRGRGDSEGTFTFVLRSHEAEDGYDSVEWAAAEQWCDGRVGTTGFSFAGANQQALAVLQPPHLTTQFIVDCGSNYWRRVDRVSGAFQEGLLVPYAFSMALTSREAAQSPTIAAALSDACAQLDMWVRSLPLRRGASPLALVPAYEDWFVEMAEGAAYDELWMDPMVSFEEHIGKYPDIPVCFVTSWYGLHASATAETVSRLRAQNKSPVHAIIGIWLHALNYMAETWAGETDFGIQASENLSDLRLRWFDRWLKGMESALSGEAPFRLFVMGGGSGRRNLDGRMCHGGAWRAGRTWPLSGTDVQVLYLHNHGTLQSAPCGGSGSSSSYTFNPRDPVPTIGGQTMSASAGARVLIEAGGYDQRGRDALVLCQDTRPLAARHDVLVFRSASLERCVEVAGVVIVRLFVTSSAPDTDFLARLIDEYPPNDDYPEGFALNLCDTIVRMRFRNGRTTEELIEPGKVYEITMDLPMISNCFCSSHRIRLDVTSSSAPRFDVNPNTGGALYRDQKWELARNSVLHDAEHRSLIRLPIVPDSGGVASRLRLSLRSLREHLCAR